MKPRILVIRGGAIGDFILTLPAIKLLREAFPKAHLEILGYQHIVALADRRFYADGTRSIEYAALSAFFVPNGELAPDLVAYFQSFQQVVSYLYDPDLFFEKNVRRCGVKHFLRASPKLDDSAHAAAQLARPLESLALYLEESGATLHPTAEDRAVAADLFQGVREPIIAVHPGSGSERKNWPLENWRELGALLSGLDPSPAVLLISGEADRENAAALRRDWQHLPILAAQDLPLQNLAAAVERCALFIGHDSGVSHLAAAVGTPCVLMFGPTDPAIWSPVHRHVTVVSAPGGNLSELAPGPVFDSIQNHFSKERR